MRRGEENISAHEAVKKEKRKQKSSHPAYTPQPTIYICHKCGRDCHARVGLIKGLSAKDLLTCYYSFVRSTTEYACQVWSTSLTSEHSHAVETIQRLAMQLISPHKTYDEALHDHRLVTLQQRRNELCNILFKDIHYS